MTDPLHDKLSQISHAHQQLLKRQRLWQRVGVWLVMLIVVVAIDAGWSLIGSAFEPDPMVVHELPTAVRLLLAIALQCGLIWVVLSQRLPQRVREMSRSHYARWCEQLANMPGNPLINAVQLEGAAESPDELSSTLCDRAVQVGRKTIQQVDPSTLLNDQPMRRHRKRAKWLAVLILLLCLAVTLVPLPHIPKLAALRLLQPLSDHPPVTVRYWDAPSDPWFVEKGQSQQITIHSNRANGHCQMFFYNPDGSIDAQLPMTYTDSSYHFHQLTINNIQQPLQVMAVGDHARSRRFFIIPQRLPRILGVEMTMTLPDGAEPIIMPVSQDKSIVGPVGAKVQLAVKANRNDARLIDPNASGLRLTTTLTKGEQVVDIDLVSSDGLRCPNSFELKLIGLEKADLTDFMEMQRNEAIKAALAANLNSGEQTDATAIGSESSDTDSTNQQSTGAPTGHDPKAIGTGGDQPGGIDLSDPLAGGHVVQSALADPTLPSEIRQRADKAPAAYRQLVAEYFLRISRDQNKGQSP